MKTVIYTPAPTLAHDAMMAAKYSSTTNINGYMERAIVWNLCRYMAANGWHVNVVDDGDDNIAVEDAKAAMELIFNLDQAWIGFKKDEAMHEAFLVLGNGEDIVSDWNYSNTDDFNDIIRMFNTEEVVKALLTEAKPLPMAAAADALLQAIDQQMPKENEADQEWLRRNKGNIERLKAWK